jgi:OOP family OmpA-OmpF porin
MKSIRAATALLLALNLAGCSTMQKPWGKGAFWGGVVGAAAGGTSGGVAANNGSFGDDIDDEKRGAAIGIGILAGGVLGALIGHALFDPEPPPPEPPAPPPPPAPPAKPLVVLEGAHFAFDSARLNPAAHAKLEETIATLKANPAMRIEIRGYTDSVGTPAYNLRLSERRAASVKDFLVSQGIAANRIDTKGFGLANPVADNSTEQGRAQNRRVEVHELK